MIARRALAVAVLALGTAACSDDEGRGTDADASAVLASIADGVIVPSYEALVEGFDTLDDDLVALCSGPDETTLEAARNSWRAMSTAWRKTLALGVGPAMERRLSPSIGFLARPASIDELLAGPAPVDVDGLASAGAAVKGISAIEIGLFADDSASLTTAAGARRCEFVTSASTLAHEAAAQVLDDWTGGHRDTFVEGMGGDPQSSVDAIVNEGIFRVTETDDQGLRTLTEAGGPDELSANRADGPAAFHLAELTATLDGVLALLGAAVDDQRLLALVDARSSSTADRLTEAARAAGAAMHELPDSVTTAFDDPEQLAAAQKAVGALKVLLSTEVASELGVTISFSDADGDS